MTTMRGFLVLGMALIGTGCANMQYSQSVQEALLAQRHKDVTDAEGNTEEKLVLCDRDSAELLAKQKQAKAFSDFIVAFRSQVAGSKNKDAFDAANMALANQDFSPTDLELTTRCATLVQTITAGLMAGKDGAYAILDANEFMQSLYVANKVIVVLRNGAEAFALGASGAYWIGALDNLGKPKEIWQHSTSDGSFANQTTFDAGDVNVRQHQGQAQDQHQGQHQRGGDANAVNYNRIWNNLNINQNNGGRMMPSRHSD